MIEEKTFHDIRKNYILASIIFILFLIYGGRIEINKILLFDLSGNWYLISAFWDIFILLFTFFTYTLIRYLIYAQYEINSNGYYFNRLYHGLNMIKTNDRLNNTFSEMHINHSLSGDIKEIKNIYFYTDEDKVEKIKLKILYENISSHIDIKSLKRYKITNDVISFEFDNNKVVLKLKGQYNNVFKISLLKFILKKEYSDTVWPLLLALIIPLILIIKGAYYYFI